jgi:hypothetical protein
MAEKYAFYWPYKTIDSLSSGNVTDAEFREFMMALFEYDRSGTVPVFEDRAFTMLFESLRSGIDYNNQKYQAIVEKRSAAGKKGGAPEGNTNAVGNRGGGAPLRNTNAAKNKHKQMVEFEPKKQTQAESVSVSVLDLEISSSPVDFEKPPPSRTAAADFINECKRLGYFIGKKKAREILGSGLNPAWLSGAFTFPGYIARFVTEKYPDLSHEKQTGFFISALEYDDRREEYQAIRERRIKEVTERADAEAERSRKEAARRNPPTACDHCSTTLAPDSRACPLCGRFYEFDEQSENYIFHDAIDVSAGLINFLKQHPPPPDTKPAPADYQDLGADDG